MSKVREFAAYEELSRYDTFVLQYVVRAVDVKQREIAAEKSKKDQGRVTRS